MHSTRIQLTILTLFLLTISILIVSPAEAQTVHALLIIMDADSSIGEAMKVDQYKVERLLTSVSRVYRVEKTVYLSSRNATQRQAVLDWIQRVKPARNDVVFVYYAGHGGMESNSYRETYLNLTDGQLRRYELADVIEKVKCRLKMLITDACSNAPRPPIVASSYAVETVSKRQIRHLFGEHEGFLHLNAASEGQYSWSHLELGSFFTIALTDLISDTSDTDRDGFVAWREVFALTRDDTEKQFKQHYPYFTQSQKRDMQRRGIKSQTPRAYSLPKRRRPRTPEVRRDPVDSLWELRNPRARFNVELQTDKPTYHINDYLTLQMETKESCYITVLNWDKTGRLTVLLPNQYESNTYVKGGQIHAFPGPESGFDFILPGPVGRERFKVIAVRSRSASQALKTALESIPLEDKGEDKSLYRTQAEVVARDKAETKILKELLKLNPADWTEASTTIILRSQ